MEILDKYVITTERFIERHKYFENINAHITNFTWRYGPDALEYADKDSIIEEYSGKVFPGITWRPSYICSALSQYSLIEECAKGKKIMTIMEDDAVLVNDFDQRANLLIDSLPDREFDLIQWGWNWDSYVFIRNHLGQSVRIDWSDKYLKVAPESFKESEAESSLESLIHTFGVHCYSLTPQGAQKLLDFYPMVQDIWVDNTKLTGISYPSATIDGAFNAFYPKMKAYIAIAPLSYVVNDKGQSVI